MSNTLFLFTFYIRKFERFIILMCKLVKYVVKKKKKIKCCKLFIKDLLWTGIIGYLIIRPYMQSFKEWKKR